MADPFETPAGFAWTYPCYVIRSTDGTTPFRRAGGFRCFPVFTDRDSIETFLVRSGFPPGDAGAVELADERAVLEWAVEVLADDCAIALDPLDASALVLHAMPAAVMLKAIKRELTDPPD